MCDLIHSMQVQRADYRALALAAAAAQQIVPFFDTCPCRIFRQPDGQFVFWFQAEKTCPQCRRCYRAPETLRPHGVIDEARAMAWSVGVLMREMATGKYFFHGKTLLAEAINILERRIDPVDPQTFPDRVINGCMSRQVQHRPDVAQIVGMFD